MKKPAETSEEFLSIIREWQALEDKTITSADELIKKGRCLPLPIYPVDKRHGPDRIYIERSYTPAATHRNDRCRKEVIQDEKDSEQEGSCKGGRLLERFQ